MDSSNIHSVDFNALAVATLAALLGAFHAPLIEMPVVKWLGRQTGRERQLISERAELKVQQLDLSMTDHFAKYSKLQRKINGIDEELKGIVERKPTNSLIYKLALKYAVKLALGLTLLILSVVYRYSPVFQLDGRLGLTPFTTLVCYPNEPNFVSFHFWMMCCGAVARFLPLTGTGQLCLM